MLGLGRACLMIAAGTPTGFAPGFPLWANWILVVVTIGLIAKGAQWVVDSSSRLARHLGMSDLMVGLTIVALGTSAPEFAVTLVSAFRQQGDISVGNVVGSNIFNLGFILGGCALIRTIPISDSLLRRDVPVLLGASLGLALLVGWDLRLGRVDGLLLLLGLTVYMTSLYRRHTRTTARRDEKEAAVEAPTPPIEAKRVAGPGVLADAVRLALGLIAVIGGAHLLVQSASSIARAFGWSDWLIAVTIVAAGTSAPELATSLVAVLKGRFALSAGNLVGSDLFNLLGVLGLAGAVRPVDVEVGARVSLAGVSAMVLLVLLLMRHGGRLTRRDGFLLCIAAVVRLALDYGA